jgi:hypothetical protein
MTEVADIQDVIEQTRTIVDSCDAKLEKARSLGLDIDEEALGLVTIRKELVTDD